MGGYSQALPDGSGGEFGNQFLFGILLVSENHAFFPVQMLRFSSRVRHLMQ